MVRRRCSSAAVVCVLVLVAAALVGAGDRAEAAAFLGKKASVYFTESGSIKVVENVIDTKSAAAYGAFDPREKHPSGFGILQIETNAAEKGDKQYYAAGYLEGVLTQSQIFDQHANLLSTFTDIAKGPSKRLSDYLNEQMEWVNASVAQNASDPYWQQIGMIIQQYQGLQDGYNAAAPDNQKLDAFAFVVLNGCGDLFDLIPKYVTSMPDFNSMTTQQFKRYQSQNGHCSALVKLTGDYSQLFMAHSSWFRYQATNRIMKHYNLQADVTVSKKISFSSYAGFLESLDDFYIMGNGLVMLQTTNNVFNTSLQEYIQPKTLLAWIRVRVASALATDGESWSKYMGMHNSGTYNNQYMVIDLNKFKKGQPLGDGVLYVSEQVPGFFVYDDVTVQLERGYWPSYNVPYFEFIYNISGYPEMAKKHGTDVTYQLAPRAKIFRRDQATVTDMPSFEAIMRYNDYKNDPYSENNPYNAICSRGDLTAEDPSPDGCYDTKVTNYDMALKFQANILNGPTTSHDLPPFSWDQFPNDSHVGLPQTYNFTFELTDPKWT